MPDNGSSFLWNVTEELSTLNAGRDPREARAPPSRSRFGGSFKGNSNVGFGQLILRVSLALLNIITFTDLASASDFSNGDISLIVKTHQVNELRFARDFKGHSFEDRGRIAHIGTGSNGDTVVVSIATGTEVGLRCMLAVSSARDAADWNKDDIVVLTGTIFETISGNLILTPCTAKIVAKTPDQQAVAAVAPTTPMQSEATAAFAFQPIPGFDTANSRPAPRVTPIVTAQPAPARQPSISVPSPSVLPLTDEQRAVDRINALYAFWSQPNEALQSFGDFYADRVNYYGAATPRTQILKEKMAFSTRWPLRRYLAEPTSLRAVCLPTGCTVTGVVGWNVVSSERGARSAGTAAFTYTLDAARKIITENGQVITRQP